MPSPLALVSVAFLMLFSFIAGIKYSNSIKDQFSWMFESAQEMELPKSYNRPVGGVLPNGQESIQEEDVE